MSKVARKLYLAGPMSGHAEHNFPLFHRTAAQLRELGFEVFNPAENIDGDISKPRSFYMRLDIPALLECEAVAFLPGWRSSRGANLEAWIATDLDMPIYEVQLNGCTACLNPLEELQLGSLPFDGLEASLGVVIRDSGLKVRE